jgi:hypothetical protein
MRRVVQRILQAYGYSTKRTAGSSEASQSKRDFFPKYLLPAIALISFGHWISEYSVVIASASFLIALAVFSRGFLAWCNTRLKTVGLFVVAGAAVLVFIWFDSNWIRREWSPTFLYLTPSHELIDCERRAFFVNHSGFKSLQNVEIVVKDNKSGSVLESDYKAGIDPGPQNQDAPRYIWVRPSHPWDEDYTITVTGTKFHSVQETVLRSNGKDIEFAVRITIDPSKEPVVSCRDALLPEAYSLGRGSRENCNALMTPDPRFLSKLQPEFCGFQQPSGDFSVVRVRQLRSASDLDYRSEDRHLTEYEQTNMRTKLSKYRGSRLMVLHTGGPKTLAYAAEFCDFFRALKWEVNGPREVAVGDERLVDVQVSVSKKYWNSPYPRAADLLASLEGIKHRQRYVYDDAISPDLVILWVGPKSPDNFRPDDCAAAILRPKPGEPHTCDFVAQVTSLCPFVPQ